jgi:hypothetical protein
MRGRLREVRESVLGLKYRATVPIEKFVIPEPVLVHRTARYVYVTEFSTTDSNNSKSVLRASHFCSRGSKRHSKESRHGFGPAVSSTRLLFLA